MNKWLMTLNDVKIEFDNFNNALSSFLKEICEYFWNHAYINKNEPNIFVFDSTCMPDAVDRFFYYLNDERIITDEEIVMEARLRMLCSYFLCDNPKKIKNNALKSINKPIDYHYKDEEIGRLFAVCRSTIFHRRKRALRLLRKEMEALENEE